jgi:hypothetical protein
MEIVNNLIENQNFNKYEAYSTSKVGMPLDVKISHISTSILEEKNSISSENRIDADIIAPKPLLKRIDEELEQMDEMLNNPFCDPALILQQAYRIVELLQRRTVQTEKLHVLETEPELHKDVQKLKGSFNSWEVLATALISGLLTAAGGLTTIASAVPGTTAGQSLAASFPDIFQFLADANNAKTLVSVGEGMKGVGQGSDVFQRIFNNGDEAKRVVLNYLIENSKRKQSDYQDASRGARDHVHGAQNHCHTVAETFHRAIESVLKGAS